MKKGFLIILSLLMLVIGVLAKESSTGFALTFFAASTGYFVYAVFPKKVN